MREGEYDGFTEHPCRSGAVLRQLIGLLVLLFCVSTAFADGVAIVSSEIRDNGDDDGFSDTLETIFLRPTVRNTTPVDLRNVVLRLSTTSSTISCITRPVIVIGDLAAGETRRAEDTFRFTVADVDRTGMLLGAFDELSATFEVFVNADRLGEPAVVPSLTIDLDLNLAGGGDRTTFFEGFESGNLNTFGLINLDAPLYKASDGYRCQYNDPDWINSINYWNVSPCWLGANQAHADATYWQVDGPGPEAGWPGRGFSGTHSLYYGIELDPFLGHTTPLATLEAVATTDPIHLAWGRLCDSDPQTTCNEDLDCPPGDRCIDRPVALSIKHQAALWTRDANRYEPADRGIVQLQLADAMGQPVGPWVRLEPEQNPYNAQQQVFWSNCSFDPIDDGNDEDSFFDPTDPLRDTGPSSTCFPQMTYGRVGDTFDPYDPAKLGFADGPGLAGESGDGTWVESTFDLSRYRGRSIRLRFLATSIGADPIETYEQAFQWNPVRDDDGWWIDDIRLDQTLLTPASVASDDNDNGGLPGLDDLDGDGLIAACDPCPDVGDPSINDSDGDGVGDACDACPARYDPSQFDTDGDGIGDACDRCPTGDVDSDLDGLSCENDNCPAAANPGQLDSDGDSFGDACDSCPFDPLDDGDQDGLCATDDNCPMRFNPGQTAVVRMTAGLQRQGVASDWVHSPDSHWVIYSADVAKKGEFALHAVPTSGGTGTVLSPVSLEPITGARISPDSSHAVYAHRPDDTVPLSLFSVPLSGDPPTLLSSSVVSYGISPDSATVVFRAVLDSSQSLELYSVPIDGGPIVKLNGPITQSFHQVSEFSVSPDSSLVVFLANQEERNYEDLHSVPIGGGTPVRLNDDAVLGGSFYPYAITPDGERVVYVGAQDTINVFELHVVPITGGTTKRLSGMIDVTHERPIFAVTSDGGTVIYRAIQTVEGPGLFRVAIGGGEPVQLASDTVEELWISPDQTRVVFANGSQLLSVPVDGGSATVVLDSFAWSEPGAAVEISADSAYVVYDSGVLESVPITGGTPVVLRDNAAGADFDITPDSATVVFIAPGEFAQDVRELFRVPIGGGTPVKLSQPLSRPPPGGNLPYPGPDGLPQSRLAPNGAIATYVVDETGNGPTDLFAVTLAIDPDADGLLRFCDNCAETANADQSDRDGDRVGDLCDNCLWSGNPAQDDSDLDGAGDACDCAPFDSDALPPAEVTGLLAERVTPGVVSFSWTPVGSADTYGVTRTLISAVGADQFGPCLDWLLPGTIFEDASIPPVGDGFAYMFQGVDSVCGSGTLGSSDGITERMNLDPSACP